MSHSCSQAVAIQKHSYRRRKPEDSLLYQILAENLETFIAQREIEGSPLPDHVIKELRAFLSCGIVQYGFLRCQCKACGHEKIVPFSCKKRGFCSSCGSKRMAECAEHLVEYVLPHADYRQFVITYPHALRYWMAASRKLSSKIKKITTTVITSFYEKKALTQGIKYPKAAGVFFTHMFGSMINLNIHQHGLMLDGVFETYPNNTKKPKYKKLSTLTDDEVCLVTEKIAKKTIKYLQKNGYLDGDLPTVKLSDEMDPILGQSDSLSKIIKASCLSKIAFGQNTGSYVQKIGRGFGYMEEIPLAKSDLCFSANGFSVHANRRIKANRRDQLEDLICYMGRASISTQRLTKNKDGSISYSLKRPFSDGTTEIRMSEMELIEKIVSIIPLPKAHMTKYVGAFAPASPIRPKVILKPGRNKAMKLTICDGSKEKKKVKNTSWARLLARVFKTDISVCPDCSGEMIVLSAIRDPDGIARYLKHIGIPTRAPPIAEAKITQPGLDLEYEDI